jgi:hypothetical protein
LRSIEVSGLRWGREDGVSLPILIGNLKVMKQGGLGVIGKREAEVGMTRDH